MTQYVPAQSHSMQAELFAGPPLSCPRVEAYWIDEGVGEHIARRVRINECTRTKEILIQTMDCERGECDVGRRMSLECPPRKV